MLDVARGEEAVHRILGRDPEFSRILSYIEAPRAHRVLILAGPVGSGRTTLIRAVLSRVRGFNRFYLDMSPAAKPLDIEGVKQLLNCYHREAECVDEVVQEIVRRADHGSSRLLIAVDGLYCVRRLGECLTPHLVRGLARLVEAYPERVRVIVSLDDQETFLELGRIAEYTDTLIVAGLPREAALELVRLEAERVGVEIPEGLAEDIVAATGGLPYHILVVVDEYRGRLDAWMRDVAEKLRWKLALIASELGVNVRDVAKALLDLVDRPLSGIPRQSYLLLRYALRENIVYLASASMVRLQLPAYRGILKAVAYGG